LTYYLNFSVPNVHDYKFEKVNNYVLEPIQKGAKCGYKQDKISSNSKSSNVKAWTQKYYPKTWFDKVFEMKSETEIVKLTVPNKIKNWKINGVSIHPLKGFTVAKKPIDIVVKGDFAINIKAPSTVKETEVFKVDVNAYSFIAGYLRPDISIEIINGFIMNAKKQEHSKRVCYNFELDSNTIFNIKPKLEPEQMTEVKSFYIKSRMSGELQIKAISMLEGSTYESEKKINVKKQEHESSNNFNVKAEVNSLPKNEATVDIDVKMESNAYSGSGLIMEVELPSGYRYVSHDTADNNRVNFKLSYLCGISSGVTINF